jgi:hypothetical protein
MHREPRVPRHGEDNNLRDIGGADLHLLPSVNGPRTRLWMDDVLGPFCGDTAWLDQCGADLWFQLTAQRLASSVDTHFVAAYTPPPGSARRPDTELMLTMSACAAAFNGSRKASVAVIVPRTILLHPIS